MRLTKIDILQYKSIKNPISIVLNDRRFVVLIGKNGSGKTNVLEAIKYAFTNRNYFNQKIQCKVQYHIQLTDEEMEEYFSCVDTDKKDKEIIVDFDNVIGRRYIKSSAIFIEAKNFKLRLKSVLEGFKKAAQRYINALKNFESEDGFYNYYTADVRIEADNGGSFTHFENYRILDCERMLTQQIDVIKHSLDEIFDGDRISLDKYENSTRLYYRLWQVPFYKIAEDEQIQISPIVASSLKISKKDLDDANVRLNKKLKEINKVLDLEYREIQAQLDEFDKIQKELHFIFDSKFDEWDESNKMIDKMYKSFMQKLKDMVSTDCYYLDNEHTLLFSQSVNRNYVDREKRIQFLNSYNPIIEVFDSFLHYKGVLDADKSLTDMKKIPQKKLNLGMELINNEFLPNVVPKFDNDEIEKFTVDFDSGLLNLYVNEKSGDCVSFNDTSLGRRWYLTFKFIKALLKPGDMIFIDEPAALLHPQAQIEFKAEIKELVKNGVYVFYSTHSPYMIPEDWGQVHNVTMTENGTQISKFESGDDICVVIREELGATNMANILFNLEKTLLLVEGVADMVCIEKFADILHRDLSSYKILPCNGSPIFDVTYLCVQQGIKFKALFDLDNKSKPENWMNKKYGYNEYLKIFKTNDNCVFTPAIRNNKSLEDCFHENDNAKYFFDYKWTDKSGNEQIERKIDKDKIKNATDFEDETKKNFEQLFMKLGIPELDKVIS